MSSTPSASAGSSKTFGSLQEYCSALGGSRVLNRVLVANNGIAAVKCIRSVRRWAYDTLGDECAVHFIAMTTPEDLRANAEYIRMADEFVEVPGGSNNNNYANVRLIVEQALACRADAVWAGWGHASEYPALPDTLLKHGITFIGPAGSAMRALGDKIGSTIIAQSAGVPTIAWNGADLTVNYKRDGLTDAAIDEANIKTVEQATAAAQRVGFPLMIKASEGGGGKGIRKVTSQAELPAAFEAVKGEVPGSPIFLMRLVNAARHLEVQLLADEYGSAIALAGRDCSVQRRHQKILEEGPVLAAPPSVWRRMEQAAVRLAEEVGYANAGTVEYLFADADAAEGEGRASARASESADADRYSFAFLELNPRLQVEHPVTEMITGVNLPAAQLHVAMGVPLHRIPDVRRLYGQAPFGDTPIDFKAVEPLPPKGHVIATRITAENPDSGFQPTSGAVRELNFRSVPDVWGYFSVDSTGRVHEFADSQIGHLFAWGSDREEARRKMVMVLKEVSIRGDIHTTVEYLADLLQTADYKRNAISTQWLDKRISANVVPAKPNALLVAVLGAVWSAKGALDARRQEYLDCVERGQLPSADLLSLNTPVELIYDDTKYIFRVSATGPSTLDVECNGSSVDVHVRQLSDGGMLVVVGGKSHVVYGAAESAGLRLMVDGATCMFTQEYDPTVIRAAQTGKLAKCSVPDGTHLAKGATFAQVEVMKMFLPLVVPESGVVTFAKAEGSILNPGDLIARLQLDDSSAVHKSSDFEGQLPQSWLELKGAGALPGELRGEVPPAPAKAQTLAKGALATLHAALDGFEVSRPHLARAWSQWDAAFGDAALALQEFEDALAVVASRLPYKLQDDMAALVEAHRAYNAQHAAAPFQAQGGDAAEDAEGVTVVDLALPSHMQGAGARRGCIAFDTSAPLQLLQATAEGMSASERGAFETLTAPLRAVCAEYAQGVANANRQGLLRMLQRYMDVERQWHNLGNSVERSGSNAAEEVMRRLRQAWLDAGGERAEVQGIYETFCAHAHLRQRNGVLLQVLERVAEHMERAKVEGGGGAGGADGGGDALLHALAELQGAQYAEVALEARQLLIRAQQPSVLQRLLSVETVLKQAHTSRQQAHDQLSPKAPSEHGDGDGDGVSDPLISLVNQEMPMADVLMMYFASRSAQLRQQAVEVYVRRLYRAYAVSALYVHDVPAAAAGQGATFSLAAWNFQSTPVDAAGGAKGAQAVPAALLEALTGTAPGDARRMVPPTALQAVPTVSAPSVAGGGAPARRGLAPPHMLPSDSYDDLAAAMSVGARQARLSSALSATGGSEDETPTDSPVAAAAPQPSSTVHVEGVSPDAARVGMLSVHDTLGAFEANTQQLLTALAKADAAGAGGAHRHVLHVVLLQSPAVHGRLDSASSHGEGRPRGDTASTLTGDGDGLDEDEQDSRVVACLTASVASVKPLLRAAGVRRVTFLVPHVRQGSLLGAADGLSAALASGKSRSDVLSSMKSPMHPHIYTLRAATDFAEDPIVRHIEPPLSGYLELRRLSNFRIRLVPTPNVAVHVYEAVPANMDQMKKLPRGTPRKRFFVRAIVRQTSRLSTVKDKLSQFPGPERVFVDCLNALEVAVGDSLRDKAAPVGNTHIFMNMLPVALVQQEYISQVIKVLAKRYAARLRRLRVSHVEFKIVAAYPPGSSPVPLRLISSSPTGYVLRVNTYVEAASPSGGTPVFMSVEQHSSSYAAAPSSTPAAAPAAPGRTLLPPVPGSSLDAAIRRAGLSDPPAASAVAVGGELDGRPVTEPYPIASEFEGKRALAAAMSDTLYVYDFMELFEKALESDWNRALAAGAGGRAPAPSVDDDDGTASTNSRPAALDGLSAGSASGSLTRPPRLMEVTELVLRRKGGDKGGAAPPAPAPSRGLPRMYSELFSNEMGQSDTPKGGADAGWGGGAAPNTGARAAPSDGASASSSEGVRLDAASPAVDVDHTDWELVESHRAPGQNTIGMVAWVLTLFTPECPQERGGRKIVIIANDITHRAGSFGTMEDRLFSEASRYARERGLPRVYLAANSGARIGLAQEVKEAFRVAWKDPADLTKGFHYLYLTPEDYKRLAALGSVAARRHVEGGEERFILTDIIGVAPDIGVENLRGSGGIAGETSRACASSCTLTYVTGRSVGIGAYLVRLGQRVIQKEGSAPIILTGYQALNKLIGRSVYASNLQLGGPHVMHANGVSHNTVGNDFEGVAAILAWLAYIPAHTGAPLPIAALPATESVQRAVRAKPPADGPYDPRALLAGCPAPDSEEDWLPGFFDRGSWSECLDGWARTVISGRARLGGIPCGVILPEVRSVTSTTPADPATPASQETQVQQAGQVWYPDSAYKTAEAIRCFNQEGLPLFVFANWRGFSGGQRDMFQEVLKFGSYIVDALVEYKQPVFVYILPRGELRGGAWVVVDPSINPAHMEMYADPTGRGGILEPSGITSIKFRQADMLAALHRVDPALVALQAQLAGADGDEAAALRSKIASREANALSAFVPAANAFADLHDTPGRMMAKGVIRGVVPWASSRGYFYWRLRRRLAEASVLQQLTSSAEGMTQEDALAAVRGWYLSAMGAEGMAVGAAGAAESLWNDDLRVLRWLAVHRESIQGRALVMRRESVLDRVVALGREDPMAVVSGVLSLVHALPAEQRNAVVGALRRGVVFASPAEHVPSHPYLPADVTSIPPSPMVHGSAGGSAMPPLMLRGQQAQPGASLDFGGDAPSF